MSSDRYALFSGLLPVLLASLAETDHGNQPLHTDGNAVDDALPDQNAIYRGSSTEDGQMIVVVDSPHSRSLRPLPHLMRHSPNGFGWGYDGNGPRDLALALLSDALGRLALCPDRCGQLLPLPYLQYTQQAVSHLPLNRPWSLSRRDITCWLLNHLTQPPAEKPTTNSTPSARGSQQYDNGNS